MGSASSISHHSSPKHHLAAVAVDNANNVGEKYTLSPINLISRNHSLTNSVKSIFGYTTPRLSLQSNANTSRNVSATSLNVPCHQGSPFTDYRIIKKIANGGFSVVHKAVAINDSHKRVAIKENDLNKLTKKQIGDLHVEINILSQLSHPGIVKFHSVYMAKDKIYMVMECLRGGELLDAICEREYYTEGDARRLMLQLVSAVDYLHSRKVIHRDIKPENIILESSSIYSNVKLVDFGFAILSTDPPSKHSKYMCGTPGYIAPEILKEGFYSTAGDVWALGIMLYILLSGAMPFDGKNESRILAAKYPLPSYLFSNVSTLAKDLIGKILVANPSDRYTALQVLHHPWMQLPVSAPSPSHTGEEEKSSRSSGSSGADDTPYAQKHNIEPTAAENFIHHDIDISRNLNELRRLNASQRWKHTIQKVVQSVRMQRAESSTPRTDISSIRSGATPRTGTGSSQSSIRTMGVTPRSAASPRSMMGSPRSFKYQEQPTSRSNSDRLTPSSRGGRMMCHQSSEQDALAEEEELILEDDEYRATYMQTYQPTLQHPPHIVHTAAGRTMTYMPRLPDDSEHELMQSHDSEDSRHVTPRRNDGIPSASASPRRPPSEDGVAATAATLTPVKHLSLIQPNLVSPELQQSMRRDLIPKPSQSSMNPASLSGALGAIAMPTSRSERENEQPQKQLSNRVSSGLDSSRQILAAGYDDSLECEEIA
jgi:serine/threonine protein kinase